MDEEGRDRDQHTKLWREVNFTKFTFESAILNEDNEDGDNCSLY